METNMSRLECKLKEIILDSRDGHADNYSKSLTEDHLHGSALGKNAFTLDDPANGTTIFMPWKLHRPLESTFNKLSENLLMSQATFKSFVDNFGLFPKFQNSRKKEDILDYVLKQASKSNGPLNFEEFLLALFLLSKYRASVLHTNEQYAFNILLNSILANSLNLNSEQLKTDFNLNLEGLNPGQGSNHPSSKSSKNLDGVIYHDSGLIVDTNIGKVYESPRKLGTKDFTEKLESIRKEESIEFANRLENSYTHVAGQPKTAPSDPRHAHNGHGNDGPGQGAPRVSPCNNSGYLDTDLVKKLLDILRDQNLLNDTTALQDSLEREIKLRTDLETSYHAKFRRLESEKDQLSRDNASKDLELGKLQVSVHSLEREYGEYKTATEARLEQYKRHSEELEGRLREASDRLERLDLLRARSQKTQQQLVLETEFEVRLFSLFSVYKDEQLVDGEFVMSEEQLISFCVDFGLGEAEPPSGPAEGPRAKLAYNKVHEYAHDGRLTYALFKEFLMNLGLLVNPDLTPGEAFRFVVFNLVTAPGNNLGPDGPEEDYHPVYVTEGNDPWASHPEYSQTLGDRLAQKTDPNRFVDVEGKVWFNRASENAPAASTDSPSTPRFD